MSEVDYTGDFSKLKYASTVKSTDYFPKGPGFNSQHHHGGSQLFVTLGPQSLTPRAKYLYA